MKRNNFNFLKFRKFHEEDFKIDLEPLDDASEVGDIVNLKSVLKTKSNDSKSDFPYLTTLAIIFVLAFFVYKFIKQRKRLRLKKFERFNR